jgi:hypothetical protein
VDRERTVSPALGAIAVAVALLPAACGGGASKPDVASLRRCVLSWNSRAANFNGQVLASGYVRRYRVREALVFTFPGGECGVAFHLPRSEAIQAVWASPRGRQWNYWAALTGRLSLGELDGTREDADADGNASVMLDGRLVPNRGAGVRQVSVRLQLARPR